jgi:hypothetical protein
VARKLKKLPLVVTQLLWKLLHLQLPTLLALTQQLLTQQQHTNQSLQIVFPGRL